MYISPLTAIQNGWITHPDCKSLQDWYDRKFICPNAIDITLDRMFELNPNETFALAENYKKVRETHERFATSSVGDSEELYFAIPHGSVDIMSDFFVDIPAGVAAFLIVRSTLNRNGLFVTSGLYDQGFKNNIGFALRNQGPTAHIAPHTRVAQIVFVKSEDSGIMYDGIYNQNEGEHWSSVIGVQEMTPPTGKIFKMNLITAADTIAEAEKNIADEIIVTESDEDRKVFQIDVGDTPIDQVKEVIASEMKKQRKPKQGE